MAPNRLHPTPTSGVFDAPLVGFGINEEWLPFVLGAVDTLLHRGIFDGDEDEVYAAQNEVLALLSALAEDYVPPSGGDVVTDRVTIWADEMVWNAAGGAEYYMNSSQAYNYTYRLSDNTEEASAAANFAVAAGTYSLRLLYRTQAVGGLVTVKVGATTLGTLNMKSGGVVANVVNGWDGITLDEGLHTLTIETAANPTYANIFLNKIWLWKTA